MTRSGFALRRHAAQAGMVVAVLCFGFAICGAQATPVERTFHESKNAVEKALKQLQPSLSGHLPTLEGFAQPGDHPLSRYQRAFYQCTVQVSATPTGGSMVRVNAKVTAWYADTSASRSGYQLVNSNGRIENDILDQLSDQLSHISAGAEARSPAVGAAPATAPTPTLTEEPAISAPVPGSGITSAFSPSLSHGLSPSGQNMEHPADAKSASKGNELRSETASLEDVVKNQAHPRNLVAIKKSGTPVVGSPSLSGKTLFLASAQDEFEMLDFNADWVHVRISGPSRGWIWRTSLEMPEGIPDVPRSGAAPAPTAADLFQVSREETAQFPGDWEPLRGKNVKIISVQKIRENEQGGASAKLEFAKSLLDKNYDELAKAAGLSGLVLIFDSADGGMIAATLPTIQRWRAGTLTDAAMWHQCYFDPPETFAASNAAGSR
ncbi:MAG: hypothetical protein WCC04_13040 [Terriglobales bacterium]